MLSTYRQDVALPLKPRVAGRSHPIITLHVIKECFIPHLDRKSCGIVEQKKNEAPYRQKVNLYLALFDNTFRKSDKVDIVSRVAMHDRRSSEATLRLHRLSRTYKRLCTA